MQTAGEWQVRRREIQVGAAGRTNGGERRPQNAAGNEPAGGAGGRTQKAQAVNEIQNGRICRITVYAAAGENGGTVQAGERNPERKR